MANLPRLGVFFHSVHQSFRVADLAQRLAFECVTLKGVWHSSSVAFLANWSAWSLPEMPQWPGNQDMDIVRSG